MAPEKAQLSGQLGYKSGAHLKELHGVVAGDLALKGGDGAADGCPVRIPIHRNRRRHFPSSFLLHQGLEVQQVALIVHLLYCIKQVLNYHVHHLIELQRHLHILCIGWIFSSHLK